MASSSSLIAGGLPFLIMMVAVEKGLSSQSEPQKVPTKGIDHRLEQGKPVVRDIESGQVHRYEVVLAEGQYAHIVIDQRGIDLVATVSDPDDRTVTESDSRNAAYGPEGISLIADQTGVYRIEVRSLSAS